MIDRIMIILSWIAIMIATALLFIICIVLSRGVSAIADAISDIVPNISHSLENSEFANIHISSLISVNGVRNPILLFFRVFDFLKGMLVNKRIKGIIDIFIYEYIFCVNGTVIVIEGISFFSSIALHTVHSL